MAVALRTPEGDLHKPDSLVQEWKTRIQQARADRERFEGEWHLNLAYAAGKAHYVWDRWNRKLGPDPNLPDEIELYHADVITESRAAVLGELNSDDDRPELLGVHDDSETAEKIQEQINDAVGHGWDHEWEAERALMDMRRKVIDYGTCAIRVHFDPTAGKLRTDAEGNPIQVPVGPDGPITKMEEARAFVLQAQEAGQTVKFREIHEGRTTLEGASPFNLLTPPGITHEKDFPWFVWVRPRPLEEVKGQYGDVAAELTEDTDIGSLDGMMANKSVENAGSPSGEANGRVRGHVWVFTCYELPCPKYPNGRVVILAGNNLQLLDVTDELPKKAPDGSYRTGVTFFHWWRRNDAFWSTSFTQNLRDPQRMIDKRKRQENEIIDRGMPKVFVQEGVLASKPKGLPLELVYLQKDGNGPMATEPHFFPGIGPGPWIPASIEAYREDLAHASTLGPVMFGENPENAQTYGQLALLNEREAQKRSEILKEHRAGIGTIVEDCVADIVKYWPEEKHIFVSGSENAISAAVFKKSVIPPFYMVKVAPGAAAPRSQASEILKIQDIWNAAVAAGAAVNDPRWLQWYVESVEAREVLDVPEQPQDWQVEKARLENAVLLEGGEVAVAEYDIIVAHLPEHREAQFQAETSGNIAGWQALNEHIMAHLELEQLKALEIAASLPAGPLPETPPPPA